MIHKKTATGAAALSLTLPCTGRGIHVKEIHLKLSSAATTSESLTIVRDSANGSTYDSTIESINLSVVGGTSFFWNGPGDSGSGVRLVDGDALVIAFTNTDTRTWGLTVVYAEGE